MDPPPRDVSEALVPNPNGMPNEKLVLRLAAIGSFFVKLALKLSSLFRFED
jgi:hypothetical protein